VTRRNLISVLLGATAVLFCPAFAQKAASLKTPDRYALAEEHARELLLLMDTDKNGKISKQEWMKFMEAEFDRLDKDKTGQIDAKELEKSSLRVSHRRASDVGK
jgi:Ca2+-binding EF-hand superfamily protein